MNGPAHPSSSSSLPNSVATRSIARRQQLADPVGSRPDRPAGELGDAVAAPAGHIVTVDLVGLVLDVDLLGAEPPATRPAATGMSLEPASQHGAKGALRSAVLARRPRLLHDDTVDDLRASVIGERLKVGKRRGLRGTQE